MKMFQLISRSRAVLTGALVVLSIEYQANAQSEKDAGFATTAPVQSPPPSQGFQPMAKPQLSIATTGPTADQIRARLRQRAEASRATALQRKSAFKQRAQSLGIPMELRRKDGGVNRLFGITDSGEPLYVAPNDAAAADTISADNVWPTGLEPWPTGQGGFGLSGAGETIGLWDPDGAVRTSHEQFSSRVTQGDSPASLAYHATWVAGTLTGNGVSDTVNIGGTPYDVGQYSRGISYGGNVVAYDLDDVFDELDFEAGNGLALSVHSYGIVAGWTFDGTDWIWHGDTGSAQEDWKFGAYLNAIGAGTRQYDGFAADAPYTLMVFAASNERNDGPGAATRYYFASDTGKVNPQTTTRDWNNGDAGGYDSLTPLECAKNVLSVGGTYDIQGGYSGPSSVASAFFSAMGPTDDGRIKPDVVAPALRTGTVTPTWNPFGFVGFVVPDPTADNAYRSDLNTIGNSFAAPNVAGALGLVLERRDTTRPNWIGNGYPIQSSTLRALAIHTADQAGSSAGPSYMYGYGLFNAQAAVSLMNADITSGANPAFNGPKPFVKEVLLPQSGDIQFNIHADGSGNPLKVTICWTDPEGSGQTSGSVDQTTARLVNDLDLRITTPSSTTLFPWILNPDLTTKSASTRGLPATTGDDSRNNVEQIVVATPTTSGDYVVHVTHKGSLSGGQQWVSIIVSGNAVPPVNFSITNIFNAGNGDYVLTYNTVVGGIYRIQGSPNVIGPYTEIVPGPGIIHATHESTTTQLTVPGAPATFFFRIVRDY